MQRTWNWETKNKVGETVKLNGWVQNVRRVGDKLVFIVLRDGSATVQAVAYKPDLDEATAAVVDSLGSEFVVELEGVVNARGEKQINPEMVTGTVEVGVKALRVLNTCKTPPFEIDKDTSGVSEELRLKYRYLDLRSDRMHRNLWTRSAMVRLMREHLYANEFTEIETAILTKGTPEGAREFLVPSRLHAGNMYVLPQSPQQFKQLLMVGGAERYFQVAKCFRDEDQRGDRQPEFTQIDLEMSFVEREEVMALIEGMLIKLVQEKYPNKKIQSLPFPRMDYAEAMAKYGNDRPDIREDKNDPNLLAFCWVINFPFFEKTEEGGWTFTHNPFSRALPEYHDDLMNKSNIEKIVTSQYDIVLNGFEIGGGSIRNHESLALQCVFEIMGIPMDEIQSKFGHMLEAFEYGAPPHGGIALGLDRLVAILQNEPNIREVIAFPKDGHAYDHMMAAPSPMPDKSLHDVHVKLDLS